MRGATSSSYKCHQLRVISIHTPHAGSDAAIQLGFGDDTPISIHTPHAGSDPVSGNHPAYTRISIHTPHAGSDLAILNGSCWGFLFQSTLPMRGATLFTGQAEYHSGRFQSTLPMRGATCHWRGHSQPDSLFQSTLPMRGATLANIQY